MNGRPGKFRLMIPGGDWVALFTASPETGEPKFGYFKHVIGFGIRADSYDFDEILAIVSFEDGILPADSCADFIGLVREAHIPESHRNPDLGIFDVDQ
jgi:hypothetical protein